MVKKYSLLAVSAVLILFSSCRKNYTCICSGGIAGHIYEEVDVKADSKVRAQVKCEAKSDPPGADGVYCELE
jgi:hypothetical protein